MIRSPVTRSAHARPLPGVLFFDSPGEAMQTRAWWAAVVRDLGLDRAPAPYADGAFVALAAAGLAGCVALWTVLRADPRGSVLAGTMAWLGALALQPMVEETLFRGLLQGALGRTAAGRRRAAGVSLANAVASAAFVGVHLVHHSPGWALATGPASLALGWLRERRGGTWSAILLHGVFNAEFFATAAIFAR